MKLAMTLTWSALPMDPNNQALRGYTEFIGIARDMVFKVRSTYKLGSRPQVLQSDRIFGNYHPKGLSTSTLGVP